jgi:HEAT repeat protein
MRIISIYKKGVLFKFFLWAFLYTTAGNAQSADFQVLLKDLQSKDSRIRLAAVEAIGKIRDERSVDTLIEFLKNKDEDWELQIRAIRHLGESKNQRALHILLQFFENVFLNFDCPAIKWNTAIALGNFRDNERVFEALLDDLYYDNLVVREAVIQSLGNIGNERAVPYLIPILRENNFALKLSAIKALEKIGKPSAIPHLKKFAVSETDPILRREAFKAIRRLNTIEYAPLALNQLVLFQENAPVRSRQSSNIASVKFLNPAS